MKVCSKCHIEKDLSDFHKDKSKKDLCRPNCKGCHKFQSLDYSIKNRININQKIKEYKKENPWKDIFYNILQRCYNDSHKSYLRYGGRGIKNFLTEKQIKKLWFRDNAYLMRKPSIDRKNNDGNYTLKNCQFIELSENAGKDKRIPILQLDKQYNLVKEWSSATEASKKLNIHFVSINNVLNKKTKTSYGFIWRFK
jgi:hypothetical protein